MVESDARDRWHFLRRIPLRVTVLLSLALLPIGLIAVAQTHRVTEEARARAASSLLALTEQAANRERQAIQRAYGAGVALGLVMRRTNDDLAACIDDMRSFVDADPVIITAGLIGLDGRMDCSSTGEVYDFSGTADWDGALDNPQPTVTLSLAAPVSRQPVLVVTQPVFDNDRELMGFVFCSLALSDLSRLPASRPAAARVDFATFNASGQVLTSGPAEDDGSAGPPVLPAGQELAGFVDRGALTFRGIATNGEDRQFAVAPIVAGEVYALGSWQLGAGGATAALPPAAFPVLMWLASLAVAYAAVNRQVIRHVRALQRSMRRFARHRTRPAAGRPADMPAEIAEIWETFGNMAATVQRDEAELEQSLHDKDVLLKEVHHRVKNNLQLISSIMNMQIRQMRSREGRNVLARLQDRVLGLATIHRNLYRTQNLSQVEVGPLLEDLIRQFLAVSEGRGPGIDLRMNFAPVALYPDQAVPLSLLASEAVTNAVKFAGSPDGGQPWLRVSLHAEPDGTLVFMVVNSRSLEPAPEDPCDGTGLGTNLIEAFAQQLEADLECRSDGQEYRLIVRFCRAGFEAELDEAA